MKIEIITISKLKTRFLEYLYRAENGERFVVIRRARLQAAVISVEICSTLNGQPK
jgi:antitoxin (DNA-binding transcriptional repressor) of toxin-antitoxin stability system